MGGTPSNKILMKKISLFLFLILSQNSFTQNIYENDLNREEVVELSFDLIDRFYEFQGLTPEICRWLGITSADEFKAVIPEFTNPDNRLIRDKIFNGLAETLCLKSEDCEPNFYAITLNQKSAKYWSDYILDNYSENSIDLDDSLSKYYRYIEGWKLIHKDGQTYLNFLIAGYRNRDECMLRVNYNNVDYFASYCNDFEGKAVLYSKTNDTIEIAFSIPEMVSPMIDILSTPTKFDFVDVIGKYSNSQRELLQIIDPSRPEKSTDHSLKDLLDSYEKN